MYTVQLTPGDFSVHEDHVMINCVSSCLAVVPNLENVCEVQMYVFYCAVMATHEYLYL